MFNWDYEYFLGDDQETGVKTTRTITLPTDRLVLLEITSRDVQHSFWVSDLAGKVDAIPGHINTMWLQIDEPGVYKGNCAEFCGTLHAEMLIEVDAIEPAEFDMWLADEQAAAGQFVPMGVDMETLLPEGDAEHGEQVFADMNCTSCHGAQPGMGPSLSQIRGDMDTHEGYTAEEFLRESILMPCKYETEGYNCSWMPSDYGEKLDAQGLADLIEYLLASGE
jgi:mono/diheme cytochrome c family protein